MRDYSEEEKVILSYFFSNLDKNVYYVKNMPEEIWATLKGSYSREHLPMRDNFLKKLKESNADIKSMAKVVRKMDEGTFSQKVYSKITGKPLERINLENLMKKAGNFLQTWAVKYGHNSLKEGAVAKIAVEDVSIVLTKVIEDNRLASYIEKSTRYLSFDKSSLYTDPTLSDSKYSSMVKSNGDMLMEAYAEILGKLIPFVMKKRENLKPDDEKKVKAWENACKAEAFDSARYILPAAVKTSLGWTVNARELEHGIIKLLSSEMKEMNEIGILLKEEGEKIFPSLIRHANVSEYIKETNKAMKSITDKLTGSNFIEDSPLVSLVEYDENLEDKMIAAMLYQFTHMPYAQLLDEVKGFTKEHKEEVFNEYTKRRGNYDSLMRAFEAGEFVFDILIDFGAFRDIQRHRIGTQLPQLLTTFHGYNTPDLIKEAGLESKFKDAMENAKKSHQEVFEEFPEQAQYMIPLAFKKRVYLKFNPRQTAYFIELRSGEQGHISYRSLAIAMHGLIEEKFPLFAKCIRVNKNKVDMARLKSELKNASKG